MALFSIAVVALLVLAACTGETPRSAHPPGDTAYWWLDRVSDDRRELTIRYFYGDEHCEEFGGVDVDEGADAVRVVIHIADLPCNHWADVLNSGTARIVLQTPLGERRLMNPGRQPPKTDLGRPPFGWPDG